MMQNSWLREEADDRLYGLFSDDANMVAKTVADLVENCLLDPELEEVIIETLEGSLEAGNDETQATVWMAVVLGEVRCRDAVGVLVHVLASSDEMFQQAAARSLRLIGQPAFEAVLEALKDPAVETDMFLAGVDCLEGLREHSLPELQDRAEDLLRQRVLRAGEGSDGLRQAEAAALALARMGVADSREMVESVFAKVGDHSNMFFKEALEIMDEHPSGLPARTAPWAEEFRWAFDSALPGGELQDPEEEEELPPTLKRRF